jgi:hypothetical protein
MTGGYCAFLLWLVYKDTTTLEFMDLSTPSKKDSVVKYPRRSFGFQLMLLSGHTKLWKALTFPCSDILPINGLEYENEIKHGRVMAMNNGEDDDMWSFNK